MVATETMASDTSPRRRARRRDIGSPGAFIVTGVIVALCALVMVNWSAGLVGDLLLAAAAIGVLFRTPHTVAVWAALTLLATTALALAFNGEPLASRFADLAYYGLAVGCLWAIWDMTIERLRWRLPGTVLHERLIQINAYPYGAALLLGAGGLAAAAVAFYAVGLVGVLLAVLAIIGVILDFRYAAAIWGGLILVVCTLFLASGGNQMMALHTGLLAAAAATAAALWACWQLLVPQFGWRRHRVGHSGSTGGCAADNPHALGSDRDSLIG